MGSYDETGLLHALVIDDDPDMRALMVDTLHPEGVQVIPAESAEAGLEQLPFFRFDAAFIDHMLPGMEGLVFGENLQWTLRLQDSDVVCDKLVDLPRCLKKWHPPAARRVPQPPPRPPADAASAAAATPSPSKKHRTQHEGDEDGGGSGEDKDDAVAELDSAFGCAPINEFIKCVHAVVAIADERAMRRVSASP